MNSIKYKQCPECGSIAGRYIGFCIKGCGGWNPNIMEDRELEILPCPKCGSDCIQMHSNGGVNQFKLVCSNCGISLSAHNKDTEYDIVTNWNTRT